MERSVLAKLPSELRDRVRQMANWQTWARMNALEPSARRQTAGRVEPLLERVAQCLPLFGVFRPLVVELPDEHVTVDRGGPGTFTLRSTVRSSTVVAPTQPDVLTALAPVIRRAVDQELPVVVRVLCGGVTVSLYHSFEAVLDPAFAVYLTDLSPAPPAPREAFLARFQLLIDRLAVVGERWGVDTGTATVMKYVGSNCIWTQGNQRSLFSDAEALEEADGQYKVGMTLQLFTLNTAMTIRSTVARFQPPAYSLDQPYRRLL